MKGYFVYMFLDKLENPLYIGISINLVNRIETQHFKSSHGNLSQDCIFETNRVLYHQAVSIDDMKIKERYLINKLNPRYNEKMNNNSKFSFDIDLDWKLYSIDTGKLIEIREKKQKKLRLKNHIYTDKNSILLIKRNNDNYLKIGLKHQRNGVYFMKINGEFYYHKEDGNFYEYWKSIETKYNNENKCEHDTFVWVSSLENDEDLFCEVLYGNGWTEQEKKNERKKLFIKYTFASSYLISAFIDIEEYNSILGLEESIIN